MVFKRYDRRLVTILSIVFVQIAGAAMILPILPLFAERQFNVPPSVVTLLVSSYFAAQFFAGPYLGRLSDIHGRVPLLVISQIGSAVSFVMMAAAGGAWVLFLARVLDGITGGNIIIAQAYITDVTPSEKRTEALGYILAAFGIGFIVGPALGGVLSAWLGPRVPFVIAGAAALVTAGMSWFLLDETVNKDQQPAEARGGRRASLGPLAVARNSALVLILIVAFVGQFGLGMLQSTFALFGDAVIFQGYSERATDLGVGLLLAVVGVGQFITQARLIGPLKRRFGDARLLIGGILIRSVALVLFAIVFSPWFAALAALIFAVGMGLMMPPLQSLATRTVDDSMRGGVLGVYQSSVSLATIISTAIAGVIFSIDPTFPYWIGALLSFLVVIPALILWQRSRADELKPDELPEAAD
jgi:DHA1 family tetracycline resistance protein-like MFS transporter